MDEFEAYRARVDAALERHLELSDVPQTLREAMHYGVFAGGKRVRPVLLYLASETLGVPLECADATACAIEFVHAYSLIHDDLPAMDDDDLRRGQPTCHIQFDEATAILAGDALQALAFEVIGTDERIPADVRLRLVTGLARAAGAGGMVAGQVLDLAAESRSVNLDELENIHHRKTGDMIGFALTAACCLAGASNDDTAALAEFGRKLGLAFQVQDDILDVSGDTNRIGKRTGSDEGNQKSTYVSLFGLNGAGYHLGELHELALAALDPFGERADPLRRLADFIIQRDH